MSVKDQEDVLIRYLKKDQYRLFRQLPIKLVDLHYLVVNDSNGLQMNLTEFEELCVNLSNCLPLLFAIQELSRESMILSGCRYELAFFDIEYLENWSISWSLSDDTESSVSSFSLPSSPTQSREFSGAVSSTESAPEYLIQMLENESSFVTDQRNQLESLLSYETSKFRLRKEQILLEPEGQFLDFCNKGSRSECLAQGRLRCLEKIHFEPVITPNTDISIGDCSYLDTCYKGKSCKFVHYKIVYPDTSKRDHQEREKDDEIPGYFETHAYPSGIVPPRPAQWIDADIRRLKLDKLGKFEAIIADPPWDIHMNSYQQSSSGFMTDQEIIDLPIEKVQNSGVFCLWVTGRALDVGRQCLAKWGYTKVEEIIWCKTNQLARIICTGRTGHWLNHSKEHCLVGIKGNVDWMIGGIDIDVITSATRDKSHKPDELYDIVERLVGPRARKLELFGRKHNIRPGWLTIGNQLSNTRVLEENLLQALR